ncbi:MAG TPA: hypothetical protein VI758_03725 [Bacteroidota bacterium]
MKDRTSHTGLLSSAVFLALSMLSCQTKSTNPELQSSDFKAFSSKCVSAGLTGVSATDSIFTWSYQSSLVIDFSVRANCCPDSDRFFVSHAIAGDTIVITAADTAGNLCRCLCTYMIHAEVNGLTLDRYIIRCRAGNDAVMIDPVHLVEVVRSSVY